LREQPPIIAAVTIFLQEVCMNISARKLLVVALLATVSSLVYAAAKADQRATSVEVRYGDLDLSSPEAVRALKRRISNAAAQVCNANGEIPGSAFVRWHRACVQLASERALAQVRWPSK
jgi:UrcA family protein